MKSNIETYNSQDSVALISLYPKKGEVYSLDISGIASYAKNTVTSLPRKAVVLCQYIGKPETYEENNALVVRCFKKNSFHLWAKILRTLRKFGLVKNVLIEFDFALYGNVFTSSLFLPFLLILKLLGYKTFVVSHSVVTDVFALSGHLGLKNNIFSKIKGFFLNKIFHLFYFILGLLAHKVIVNEQTLKERLNKYVKEERIVVIPHGVDCTLPIISQNKAKQKLGINENEQVVLFFGFINWFKGADFFVDTYSNLKSLAGRKVRFIIAGGKSATMKGARHYQKYYDEVIHKIKNAHNIEVTGFVAQNDIGLYFSAADLVVFPYRHFMSASGVLSLTFSYKKPFIVSKELADIFPKEDLSSVGLTRDKIAFSLDPKSCVKLSETVLSNGVKEKMLRLAEIMQIKRNWRETSHLYNKTLFEPAPAVNDSIAFRYAK